MRISKVVRRKRRGATSVLNAVIAANVGESGQDTVARGRQHVEMTQRDGHTEVHEHHTDDKGS